MPCLRLLPLVPFGDTKRRHDDEVEDQDDVGANEGGTSQEKKLKKSFADPADARLLTRPMASSRLELGCFRRN